MYFNKCSSSMFFNTLIMEFINYVSKIVSRMVNELGGFYKKPFHYHFNPHKLLKHFLTLRTLYHSFKNKSIYYPSYVSKWCIKELDEAEILQWSKRNKKNL